MVIPKSLCEYTWTAILCVAWNVGRKNPRVFRTSMISQPYGIMLSNRIRYTRTFYETDKVMFTNNKNGRETFKQ